MSSIKVLIADDHAAVRKGYISVLNEETKITVTGEAPNGKELLKMVECGKPDVVLMDLEMPLMDGDQTLAILNVKHPNIKVIIITEHHNEKLMFHYFKKGANAYLPKDNDITFLSDAIFRVMSEGFYVCQNTSLAILRELRGGNNPTEQKTGLTIQEVKVIKLICDEKSNKEIADALNIVVRTVDFHRKNIYSKTSTCTSAGLVKYAILNGIIVLTPLQPPSV